MFVATGPHGAEIYGTDGTTAGTVLVKDIAPGPANSLPEDLVAFKRLRLVRRHRRPERRRAVAQRRHRGRHRDGRGPRARRVPVAAAQPDRGRQRAVLRRELQRHRPRAQPRTSSRQLHGYGGSCLGVSGLRDCCEGGGTCGRVGAGAPGT
ncbi:MAG: hypothetical protein KAI24_12730 [Planctomycetes bacterium]|nr:hypothetical protein [Planctomycetota bacterium]